MGFCPLFITLTAALILVSTGRREFTYEETSNAMKDVQSMKTRIGSGEVLQPAEYSEWILLADQMVKAILANSSNVHKYFSDGASQEDRKQSACFSLTVAMDDFALCIEAETILKQVPESSVKKFWKQWENTTRRARINRTSQQKLILKERRARYEGKLKLCTGKKSATKRENCIVKLEEQYLEEKYSAHPDKQETKLKLTEGHKKLRDRKNSARMLLYSSVRDVRITTHVNLFDVPSPDDEQGSLCTQFCCQEGSEHELFCNLLIECV